MAPHFGGETHHFQPLFADETQVSTVSSPFFLTPHVTAKVHDVRQLKLPRSQPWHVLLIDQIDPPRGDGLILARPQ
jgi:hypothetical protein